MIESEDFLLSSYDYLLPEASIAQFPAATPGSSRLLVLPEPPDGVSIHTQFSALCDHLPAGALLVANNSRVTRARLAGRRPGGGKVEFLLLTPLPLVEKNRENGKASAQCLLRPGAKISCGDILDFPGGLKATVMKKSEYGRHDVLLEWTGRLSEIFSDFGSLPLPPYIRRKPEQSDETRYQTIYASREGSVAAPTAGLHFTSAMRDELDSKGFDWLELTLHVGYGTFSPVRCQDIRDHKMHKEYVEIEENAAKKIRQAQEEGRPIVAVGTTSLRALEAMAAETGCIAAFSGWTDIFFYPGRQFKIVDALLTNFHLPQSSLLMLVSAFAGRKRILAAYSEAIAKGYRFFSYGDAMLIMRNGKLPS